MVGIVNRPSERPQFFRPLARFTAFNDDFLQLPMLHHRIEGSESRRNVDEKKSEENLSVEGKIGKSHVENHVIGAVFHLTLDALVEMKSLESELTRRLFN